MIAHLMPIVQTSCLANDSQPKVEYWQYCDYAAAMVAHVNYTTYTMETYCMIDRGLQGARFAAL